jgi:cytoskeletal protein CcmA (bactofilin family)
MMALFRKDGTQGTLDSLIGSSVVIRGNVEFEGGLRIDGHVYGEVRGRADQKTLLVLSETAVVTGGIQATHLVINGTVEANLVSGELVELQAHARIKANVAYRALEMQSGAVVEGQLSVVQEGKDQVESNSTFSSLSENT